MRIWEKTEEEKRRELKESVERIVEEIEALTNRLTTKKVTIVTKDVEIAIYRSHFNVYKGDDSVIIAYSPGEDLGNVPGYVNIRVQSIKSLKVESISGEYEILPNPPE
ncbi:MAG: hypothetical protein QXP36_09015 [Conexivisphaerales archaeon]